MLELLGWDGFALAEPGPDVPLLGVALDPVVLLGVRVVPGVLLWVEVDPGVLLWV